MHNLYPISEDGEWRLSDCGYPKGENCNDNIELNLSYYLLGILSKNHSYLPANFCSGSPGPVVYQSMSKVESKSDLNWIQHSDLTFKPR